MHQIELCNGYYIEIDPLNHALRQRYIGETKTGEKKEGIRTHGYYPDNESAIEAFVNLNQIDYMADLSVDLRTCLQLVKKANEAAVQAIKSAVEGKEQP